MWQRIDCLPMRDWYLCLIIEILLINSLLFINIYGFFLRSINGLYENKIYQEKYKRLFRWVSIRQCESSLSSETFSRRVIKYSRKKIK